MEVEESALEEISSDYGDLSYHHALKKVKLVERSAEPGGVKLINAGRTGLHEASDIIALAGEIQNADAALKNVASGKLSVILEQIRFLQKQAQTILEETEKHNQLHNVACNFRKVPGKIYHLYEKESEQKCFSMLSPEEWGSNLKDKYLGSFRLELDQTWTSLDKIREQDKTNSLISTWMKSKPEFNSNLLSIGSVDDQMQ